MTMWNRARILRVASATALAGSMLASSARADLQWGPGGAGGDGVWDAGGTSNWYDGTTNVPWNNTGAIFGGTAGTVNIDPAGVSATGLTFNTSGYQITGGNLTLTGAPIISVGAALDTASINSNLVGTVGFTKAGAGLLSLGGTNTLTGTAAINAGTVQLASAGALNSSSPMAVAFGSGSTGILQLNGNSVTISSLATNATPGTTFIENANATAAALTVNQSASTTFAGVIRDGTGGGALALTKTGTGTLTLSGSNTFTGDVAINGGVIAVGAATNLSSTTSTVSINGGTLRGTSSAVGAEFINSNHPIVIGASGGTIDINQSAAILFYRSGTISGSGIVTKSGGGTLRLSNTGVSPATNTLVTVPKIIVTGGLWQGGADTTFGAVPSSPLADAITLNGGGISANASITLVANRGITIGSSGGTFNASSSFVVAGKIVGTGAVTKTGASTTTFTGLTSYNGSTTITAGTLKAGAANSLSVSSAFVLSNAAVTLDLGGFNEAIGSLAGGGATGGTVALGAGTLTNGANNSSTIYSGIITGTGGLTKTGSGTLTLDGASANAYTGLTTVLGGGTLALNKSGVNSIAGNLTLGGATAGTARLVAANQIADTATLTLAAGGKFDANGLSETMNTLSVTGSSTLDFGSGSSSVIRFSNAGTISSALNILNWSGNPDGNGTEQLFVGTDGTGLNSTQLGLITFTNPAGQTGTFGAQILSTGEVVPAPEPGTVGLLAVGAAALGLRRRRRPNR